MLHPDSERIASFDHDPPSAEESKHISDCPSCQEEVRAFTLLAQMARELDVDEAVNLAPLASWESVSRGLRREGLIMNRRAPRSRITLLMKAAAAIVVIAGSVAVGRMSAGISATDADSSVSETASSFVSVSDAKNALDIAQLQYERASLWLSQHDSTPRNSDVYRARLAALDQMMAASRAALLEAPEDALMNHYFLTAFSAREATIQQLGSSLPVDKSLESY